MIYMIFLTLYFNKICCHLMMKQVLPPLLFYMVTRVVIHYSDGYYGVAKTLREKNQRCQPSSNLSNVKILI